jgi:hypothetical protein
MTNHIQICSHEVLIASGGLNPSTGSTRQRSARSIPQVSRLLTRFMTLEILTKRRVLFVICHSTINSLRTVQESGNLAARVKVPPPSRLIRRVG